MRNRTTALVGILTLVWLATGCNGPRRIHETPVIYTGDRVAVVSDDANGTAAREGLARRDIQAQADSIRHVATASCEPAVCTGIHETQVVLGMTEAQVLAASQTTAGAWNVWRDGTHSVMSPAFENAQPRDGIGALHTVQLENGRVVGVSRQTRTGTLAMRSGADTSAAARLATMAQALIREGDDFVLAGDRALALERYDRALILDGDNAMLNYKVAQLLDQQLRPQEALMRYQKFLLQMDLQRIDALGTQQAKLAEAIALAQQRVIVLDRRSR
jgi:hypothetical protein